MPMKPTRRPPARAADPAFIMEEAPEAAVGVVEALSVGEGVLTAPVVVTGATDDSVLVDTAVEEATVEVTTAILLGGSFH